MEMRSLKYHYVPKQSGLFLFWIQDSIHKNIQEGKLLNRKILFSGTAEGIEVIIFLAYKTCVVI